jgi:multidrug efflux pump subunit AcrA (membrane-fusion protein)
VLTIERQGGNPFSEDDLLVAEACAALVGPVLAMKQRSRRLLSGRLPDAIGAGLKAVLGPRRPALKLLVLAVAGFLVFLIMYRGTFRVSADAVLEGAVQRAAVAPFNGFIAEAPVRAGDLVEQGELLAALDDKDLRLEELRWQSEHEKLKQERRRAVAERDRAQIRLISAQIGQTEAQLRLTGEQLARTRVLAPIAGLVLSGDLSQRLGTPVSKGEVLFEIAPLAGYRVILDVDERDIRYIEPGQRGRLLLAGGAGEGLEFRVTNVTAVSQPGEGRNRFRVDATLDAGALAVRPGMEGVGKIGVDERSLAWIWTRRLVEWLRVFVWEWTP